MIGFSSARLTFVKRGVVALAVAALAGCTTGTTPHSAGADAGFVTASGVTEIAVDKRVNPIALVGADSGGNPVGPHLDNATITVVNVWYASCGPCRKEAPGLVELANEFESSGVRFVGVNVRDEAETAAGFERNFNVPYPSIIDTDAKAITVLAGMASPNAVPTTLVLDRDRRVAARVLGQADESVLRTLIKTVLAES